MDNLKLVPSDSEQNFASAVPSEFPEDLEKSDYKGRPHDYVIDNAKLKALDVFKKGCRKDDIIVGCDTVVTLDGSIIEKPKGDSEAFEILKKLSGRVHCVFTGLALIKLSQSAGDPVVTTSFEKTDVHFANLTDNIIQTYVRTGEPLDKAGAYGIQGAGAILVEKIVGDYYNVMGLPLYRLMTELQKFVE